MPALRVAEGHQEDDRHVQGDAGAEGVICRVSSCAGPIREHRPRQQNPRERAADDGQTGKYIFDKSIGTDIGKERGRGIEDRVRREAGLKGFGRGQRLFRVRI